MKPAPPTSDPPARVLAHSHDQRVTLRRNRDGMGDDGDDRIPGNQLIHDHLLDVVLAVEVLRSR